MDRLRSWCCALLVATLAPAGAAAGVRFDFTTEVTGYSYRGHMRIDGTRARVDITEGNHPFFNPNTTIISLDRGRQLIILDHAQKTYYKRRMGLLGGHLPATRGLGTSTASKPRVRTSRAAGDTIGGVVTQRHIINVEYDLLMTIEGQTLSGSVAMEARFDIAQSVAQRALPWGLQFATKTGYESIDRAIAGHVPSHLPLRQIVSVSRRISDGDIVTETITTTVTNVRRGSFRDEDFWPARGYQYQEPVFKYVD